VLRGLRTEAPIYFASREEGTPQPTRWSGERPKFPQRGPGNSPGRKRILVHFELNESDDDEFDIFVSFIAHI